MKSKNYRFVKVAYFSADNLEENKSNEHNRFFKRTEKWTVSKYKLWKAYHSDYEEYNHWQYHNPNVKTQNALEAKILRQTHVIEKGMSLSHPREKFGVQKALELLDFIDEFVECG